MDLILMIKSVKKDSSLYNFKASIDYSSDNSFCGITEDIVRNISAQKNEPSWMLKLRLDALKIYSESKLPEWGPSLDELALDKINSYIESSSEISNSWDKVPTEIRDTFERLGIPEDERKGLAGVGAQFDSEVVYHNLKDEMRELGVVYCDLESALHGEYADLIRQHFMTLVRITDHKFAALHAAVWSGGSFVYVPKGVSVEIPLQSYFRLNAPGAGQFEHTLIIAEDDSFLHFIEGCSAPKYNVANLHAGCVEIFVGKNARVRYSTIENWSKNMFNLNTKKAHVSEGGMMEWVAGSFGSHISYLYPTTILDGENAKLEYTGITFAGEGQNLDTGMKAIHAAPNTSSLVSAKSIAHAGGTSTFRSLIKVLPGCNNCKTSTDCDSLLLDSESRSDSVPILDFECGDVDAGHEARIGKVDEESIYYLMSRGLSESDAKAIIVGGFVEPISKELPMEYAVEMNNLVKIELEKGGQNDR